MAKEKLCQAHLIRQLPPLEKLEVKAEEEEHAVEAPESQDSVVPHPEDNLVVEEAEVAEAVSNFDNHIFVTWVSKKKRSLLKFWLKRILFDSWNKLLVFWNSVLATLTQFYYTPVGGLYCSVCMSSEAR